MAHAATSSHPTHTAESSAGEYHPRRGFIHKLRGRLFRREEGSLKDMIEEALEDSSLGSAEMSEEERTLLKNVVALGEITVRDIMIPRTDILALERDTSLSELLSHVQEIGHTRVPVYHESLDKIEGFIHVKDLFAYISHEKPFVISEVLREVLFVAPSMRIVDLLLKMRLSGCHMAIVVDEYGGTDGLVTMEDLFEEIVGEIQDEHDDEQPHAMYRWVNDHVLEVDVRADIDEVEQALGTKLHADGRPPGDYDTLGGFLIDKLGRVPAKGEVLACHDIHLKIEITSADPRRVYKARIIRLPKHVPAAAQG